MTVIRRLCWPWVLGFVAGLKMFAAVRGVGNKVLKKNVSVCFEISRNVLLNNYEIWKLCLCHKFFKFRTKWFRMSVILNHYTATYIHRQLSILSQKKSKTFEYLNMLFVKVSKILSCPFVFCEGYPRCAWTCSNYK